MPVPICLLADAQIFKSNKPLCFHPFDSNLSKDSVSVFGGSVRATVVGSRLISRLLRRTVSTDLCLPEGRLGVAYFLCIFSVISQKAGFLLFLYFSWVCRDLENPRVYQVARNLALAPGLAGPLAARRGSLSLVTCPSFY